MALFQDFKAFISRGNVVDMAVGIIVGAAFTGIVNSLVTDMLNPLLGLLIGGIDFSDMRLALTSGENGAVLAYGNFIMAVINFLIIAWAVFLMVRAINRVRDGLTPKPEPVAKAAPAPSEAEILMEIRDLLRAQAGSGS